MAIFELYKPSSLDEAVDFLAKHYPEALPIAGGTELLVLIRDKKVQPKYLVDLMPLKSKLSYVKIEDGRVKIGALTTIWELSQSVLHKDPRFLGFKDVWSKFGTLALRFSATIGGNIGTATDFSDYVVLLLAYDANVKLYGPGGAREVLLEKLLLDRRKLDLKPGEIIVEVSFPEPPQSSTSSFVKFDRRQLLIGGLANTATYLHLDGKRIVDVKVSLDMVREKRIPGRLRPLEDRLKGKELSRELVEAAVEEIVPKYVEKFTDWWTTAEYRLEMTKVSIKRAIFTATERLGVI